MERILSQDERIRRAEEIYARRRNLREKTKRATVNVSEAKNFKLLKKLVLQIIICILIYFIFYLINTTNYSFSEVTLNKTNELISSDIDFMKIYNDIKDALGSYLGLLKNNGNQNNNEEQVTEDKSEPNNEEQNNKENEENQNENEQENKVEEGKTNEVSNAEVNTDEETGQKEIANVNMSETDRIKSEHSFILPVSRLGFF